MAERRSSLEQRADKSLDELSEVELRQQLEMRRQLMSQRIAGIRETMKEEYVTTREAVEDALDYRNYVRRNPMAFSAGALGAGFLIGYLFHNRKRAALAVGGTLTAARSHEAGFIERSQIVQQLGSGLAEIATHFVHELTSLGRNELVPMLVDKIKNRVAPEMGTSSSTPGGRSPLVM